jgi:predicted patatin/cPLA2 family phospholipase
VRKKTAKVLRKKMIFIRTTKSDKIEVEKLAKDRGLNLSEYFRELVKEDRKRSLYQPYINSIEQQNRELTEKLWAVEKCIRVLN